MKALHRAILNALPGTTRQVTRELYQQGVVVHEKRVRIALFYLAELGMTQKKGGHTGRWQ